MRALVTGATGFVGRAVLAGLQAKPGTVAIGAVRSLEPNTGDRQHLVAIGDLRQSEIPAVALSGVDVVVHCAARVHVMQDRAADPLAAFREVNVGGTVNLARQAAAAGVRRFIFLSSVKVHGETTQTDRSWTADAPPSPQGPYARSKFEAETALRAFGSSNGLEIVIIRPPLVHGPGVKANFLSLMTLLYRRVPLPFGAIDNKRSIVSLDNLVDLIDTCARHPKAANEAFLVSDGGDFSTTELLSRMGQALGRPARLWPVPKQLVRWAAVGAGKEAVFDRLYGSLTADIGKNEQLLGWRPPISASDALIRTAAAFLSTMSAVRAR